MENFDPTKSSNHKKIKWLLFIISTILLISIIFNLTFAYLLNKQGENYIKVEQNPIEEIDQEKTHDELLIQKTHEVDKEITDDTLTWLGIKSVEREPGLSMGSYELWRIDNYRKHNDMIANFQIGYGMDVLGWNLNEEGGVDLVYMVSPGEAFRGNSYITYDEKGEEQFRLIHNSASSIFTFQTGKNAIAFKVNLILEGKCEGYAYKDLPLPEITLKGVKISRSTFEKDHILEKPKKISCAVGYGDSIIYPIIDPPIYDKEKIEFILPNSQKTTISLKKDDYLNIYFE